MVLKCADIGHLAADVATHKRWAYQLEEEFFRQVSHNSSAHAHDHMHVHRQNLEQTAVASALPQQMYGIRVFCSGIAAVP